MCIKDNFTAKNSFEVGVTFKDFPYFVGNKAKGRISKRVFQENKTRQIFRKTNISYPLVENVCFRKNWRALFSWNTRIEIRPFALLTTFFFSVVRLSCYSLWMQPIEIRLFVNRTSYGKITRKNSSKRKTNFLRNLTNHEKIQTKKKTWLRQNMWKRYIKVAINLIRSN